MRKIFFGILATVSGLVLLFSYRTSLGETVEALPVQDAAATGGSADASSTTTTQSTTQDSTAALADGTYLGDSVNTRFGPVAVQITVADGVITEVTVPEYPDGNSRDREISSRAIPQLISETTAAQSAGIDMVSGATYTSEGYARSLQSAIDQAFG
ncbi:FMN-binding protein [Microbacterium sulfonylureivorans]|uniref:FMN-binding protein n=1 Tax=Microbacterium sulfonylureivorans TaxID=2486854 RepID=UPI000FDB9BDD|nr:FMN-binding protein [Microbacterium sulfonylureivorans]